MFEVSEAWKQAHTEMLSPETFVEVRLLVGKILSELPKGEWLDLDVRLNDKWVAYKPESYTHHIHQIEPVPPRYDITLEENLWLLDGSRTESSDARGHIEGYEDESLTYRIYSTYYATRPISTLTIVWSSEYNEYPTRFEILVYPRIEGDGIIVPTSFLVTGNKSVVSVVDLNITDFSQIHIKVPDWNTPNHHQRIDQVYFGKIEVFDKNDLLSFTHEESCDLLTASLPKNEIAFSVSNVDGRWDPNNPEGIGQHLMEQQKLSVRYGTEVNGIVEWIQGGIFFLSEWTSTSGGLEFSFVAQDAISRLVLPKQKDAPYSGVLSELLDDMLVTNSLNENAITIFVGDEDISDVTNSDFDSSLSGAANLQLLANEHMRIFHHDRRNRLIMAPLDKTLRDYPMPLDYAYSYPKITLSKPLRNVVLRWYGTVDGETVANDYVALEVEETGVDQVIDNKRLYLDASLADSTQNPESLAKTKAYAEWVRDMLVSRKTISGEFRADPRLEVLDVVSIESKYGVVEPVALTTVKYTYNGSFRGYYEGRVL